MRPMTRDTALQYRLVRGVLHTMPLIVLVLILPVQAESAVRWEALARTGRHNVAVDTGSLRMTSLGRLAAWLRFTPLDETRRRQAAAEYGEKGYRFHYEYYEIDCGEHSSLLGLIDIIGPSGKRLARLKGGSAPDPIEPGSALELAAQRVCPVLEDAEEESVEPEAPKEGDAAPDDQDAAKSREQIQSALQKTVKAPADPDAWRELGNAYFDADMPREAIDAYARVLVLRPDDADVLNDQGAMYRQTGDLQRAVANFERAVAAAPFNLESLYNLGYVYAFDLKLPEKARTVWRRYLQLDSVSETARQVRLYLERDQGAGERGAQERP